MNRIDTLAPQANTLRVGCWELAKRLQRLGFTSTGLRLVEAMEQGDVARIQRHINDARRLLLFVAAATDSTEPRHSVVYPAYLTQLALDGFLGLLDEETDPVPLLVA